MIQNDYLNTLTSKALMDKAFSDRNSSYNSYQNKQDMLSFDEVLKQTSDKKFIKNGGFDKREVDLEKLREQTDAFESIMIKTVLDLSLKQDVSLFPKAVGSDIYSDMYNDAMSKSMGGGLGFSDLLYDFLKERV